jgi:polar amino acid transport system permease protein
MMQKNKSVLPAVDKIYKNIAGVEPSSWIDPWWGLVIFVIALTIFLAVVWPDPYWRIIAFVSDGIVITITATAISFVLILIVGLIGGLGRLSKNKFIRGAATIYVEVIRGIPILVQLIFWYYAFPTIIQDLGEKLGNEALKNWIADPMMMAILGLTFCYAAYMSEIYRAGIQSIAKGQMEAARSLGMTYVQAMRHVILPQALRVILPPVGNEFISLLKDSSLLSVVAMSDLTRRGREFAGKFFIPIETYSMIALLYLIMTLMSARVVNLLESKTRMESR